ncbi:MAG: 6-phosphogluconate dehydrogenase [Candidatus Parcubacteria bacterium]|nr:MAG: 6-phosphogluconate dehydrogenase [Candidatus Parcubacteria bacterium]
MEHKQVMFVGLGRMGRNMAARLVEQGFAVAGYDVSPEAREAAQRLGAQTRDTLEDAIALFQPPRVVWIMVQRDRVEEVFTKLVGILASGEIIIDGGNTFYQETLARLPRAHERGIHFVDVGVSGGTERARTGATLMVGGEEAVVSRLAPLLDALAQPGGWARVGANGAGHYVKMVHNGIEYGMMQALAEGVAALKEADKSLRVDVEAALRTYAHGSIIEGSLVRWALAAWEEDPGLARIEGVVPPGDTENEMRELARFARMPALQTALAERERSRAHPSFAMKVVAALRKQFGSHPVVRKKEDAP